MALDLQYSTNYLLGRGKVVISENLLDFYDMGNTPSFNYNIEATTLEHKNSRDKLKKTDKEVTTEITASGTINLDTVHPENIKIFLLGDSVVEETQSSASSQSNDAFVANAAQIGKWKYVSDDESGQGNFTIEDNLSNVVVQNVAEDTTYVLDRDYHLDARAGLIMILATGTIPADDTLHIDYDVGARTRYKVAAAKVAKIERHLRFIGNPATGSIIDVQGYVNMYPEGEMALVGDEWAAYNINYKFVEKTDSYTGLLEHIDYGEAS